MKKTVVILVVVGLLIGTAAGLAFAFSGNNANEPEAINDEEINYEADKVEEVNEADEMIVDDGSDITFDIDDIILPDWSNPDEAGTPHYLAMTGNVVSVEKLGDMIRVEIVDVNGNPAFLVLDGNTVFPFSDELNEGDLVTGWYVANAPMIMIWPAEYNIAVLIADAPEGVNIKVDRFYAWEDGEDGSLLSQDEMFAFRMDDETEVILANGDDFTDGEIEGRRIVVIYGRSTRSIPEMATADKIIVLYESIMPL